MGRHRHRQRHHLLVPAHRHWLPFFDNLRLYLTHFAGQRVTSMEAAAHIPGHADTVWSAIRQALGAGAVGQPVEARGLTGQVERIGTSPGPHELLLRLTDPVAGFLGFFAHDKGDGSTMASIQGYLFSDDAPGYIEREQPAWQAWLESLGTAAAHR